MKVKENAFVFYLSGIRDNDTAVSWWLQRLYSDYDSMLFKLPYTPPYKDFSSIRNFQIQSRFHPFTDTLCRERLAVIDLSEWIDPQAQLDYLEIFFQFLHDRRSFYRFQYIFTAGTASRSQIDPICRLACRYLEEGRIHEDRTFTVPEQLATFLQDRYLLDDAVAQQFARIFIRHGEGPAQMDAVLRDLVNRLYLPQNKPLSLSLLFSQMNRIVNSKVFLLYEKEITDWNNERKQIVERSRVSA